MADERLRMEITETKEELQRFRERVQVGAPAIHLELSLNSLYSK
jgi:hypothetical protein